MDGAQWRYRNGQGGETVNISQSVDEFCQKIWDEYEERPETLPAEVTLNNLGTGIIAKVDDDGLYFEANGEEFDLEEWFMENNFASDTLDIQPINKEHRPS
jgi:hypothetical protein